jgi:hypothetical protein
MRTRNVVSAILLLFLALATGVSSVIAQGAAAQNVASVPPDCDCEEAYNTGHQTLPANYPGTSRCVWVPGASLGYRHRHRTQPAALGCDEAFTTGHQKFPAAYPPCRHSVTIQ